MSYAIHQWALWICVGVVCVVFCIMIHSVLKFRRPAGAGTETVTIGSTKVELVWAIIPFAILFFTALPAAEAILNMTDTRSSERAMRSVTENSEWRYRYRAGAESVDYVGTAASFNEPWIKLTPSSEENDPSGCAALGWSSRAPASIVGSPLCAGIQAAFFTQLMHQPVATTLLP